MNYWQFRLSCYRHELALLLTQLKQLSLGLVNLFPLAMPALLMMPLVVLALLADPQTPPRQYVTALWAYQLLLHSWLLLQQKAILAQPFNLYAASLPVGKLRRALTDCGLIIYAAHLLVVAPLAMLLGLLFRHADKLVSQPALLSLTQFLPLVTLVLLTLYYSWAAVYRRYPWLSLLAVPFGLLPFSHEISVLQVSGFWLLAIVVEQLFKCYRIRYRAQPTSLTQLYFAADMAQPKTQLLRLVALLLLLVIADSFMHYSSSAAQPYIAGLFDLIFAVLLATKLLDALTWRQQYQLYIDTLGISAYKQHWQTLLYVWLYSLPMLAIIAWFGLLTLGNLGLILLFYLVTQLGILCQHRYFLAWPITIAVLLLWSVY